MGKPFPGQYFDGETGLHYNYFRDYDPLVGRYITNDPIGLNGGINKFSYALQNSLRYIDLYGLKITGRFFGFAINDINIDFSSVDTTPSFGLDPKHGVRYAYLTGNGTIKYALKIICKETVTDNGMECIIETERIWYIAAHGDYVGSFSLPLYDNGLPAHFAVLAALIRYAEIVDQLMDQFMTHVNPLLTAQKATEICNGNSDPNGF